MSSRLYFARHGESTANLSRTFANREGAFPLTALGISQAHDLAVRLRSAGVTAIRSSPLLRALETAEIVAEVLDTPFSVADGLHEFDVGRWEGTNLAEGWTEYEAVTKAWLAGDDTARVGGGESRTDVCTRMALLIQELGTALNAGESVLCVGHAGTYRAALPGLLANVTREFAAAREFPNTGMVVAEARGSEFVCIDWCGDVPPGS